MEFLEVIEQARAALQSKGRLTYRTLKRQFALDDEALEDLKEELLFSDPQITEVDSRGLVWNGAGPASPSPSKGQGQPRPPVSYTPPHLAERILAEQAAMESRGSANGERKTITALFADLKGSTALIEGLDPEEARALIDPALQLMMDAVHRYEGYVAQALGDGIFALFGAPIAHEDHPQRALYAALRMQEEMRGYGDQVRLKHGVPLQMRVGINTGEVVVRSIRKDDLHTDYVPVGHSTTLAARMEQLANPGSIVVSEYTRKLTEGYFELKALGAATIKGVEEPLNVYEVIGAGPLRTRFQVTARRGLSRFVGRQSELDQLRQALEQAKAGHGQIVGVMGEPGLGKSRLFYEFKLTSQSGCRVLEAFAVSHGKASPYLPLIELLKAYFEIEASDDDWKRREKVTGKVLTLDRSLEDTLPYLCSLLGIEDPQSNLQQMDAQIRRQRTFAALKTLFLRESLNHPLILVFEDLHWLDSETQSFLDVLSESVASANLLLLVNYRPEYRHEWGRKTYYIQLRLAPLGQAEADELLTFLLGADASLITLKQLILARTEGTPFFLEEVVQTLVEEGALSGERGRYRLETTPTELHISPTVQGVLAARIDRLTADEKALLQQLSVIGRQFPVSLIEGMVAHPEPELHRLLSALQAKELLYEQPAFPETEYLFKHALTQEVAYGTVLHEQRRAWHERTGQAIEALYKQNLDDHYSRLAYHYQQSGNTKKAVEYLGLAGRQAVERAANKDAVQSLSQAIELLQTLPETTERKRQELRLQTALGTPLNATQGYGSAAMEQAFSRALALGRELGESALLFPVLFGMWMTHYVHGNWMATWETADQLAAVAEHEQDPSLRLVTYYVLMCNAYAQGDFQQAHALAEQGKRSYDAQQHGHLAYLYSTDPGVAFLGFGAYSLWHLGYPAQALQQGQASVALGQELGLPFVQAYAGLNRLWILHFRRDAQAAQRYAEEQLTLCQEHGIPVFLEWAMLTRGWARAVQGQAEEGVSELQEGLALLRTARAESLFSYYLTLLAEAYEQGGDRQAALRVVSEAQALVSTPGESWWEAEVYRLKGTLILQSDGGRVDVRTGEAEAYFHRALTVARRQKAKSLELRAATSLARLWQQQGKTIEARGLFAPVYNWFTEGFDTADLKDAKALLDSLS